MSSDDTQRASEWTVWEPEGKRKGDEQPVADAR